MKKFLAALILANVSLLCVGLANVLGSCPPGNMCCEKPLPTTCYNQPCAASGTQGVECQCCIVNGAYVCQACSTGKHCGDPSCLAAP